MGDAGQLADAGRESLAWVRPRRGRTVVARAGGGERPFTPNAARGEITDKGSLNQRAVLERRAELVEEMYADGATRRLIRLKRE